ncbi:MAG: carboxypeptidase regulatory-like domain-containing protein [Bacteroidota bacterium]
MTRGNLYSYGISLILLFALGCGGEKKEEAAKPEATPAKATGIGAIAGKVNFTGKAPRAARLRMNADPVCLKQHTETVYGGEVVVNENGTLRNVLIYIREGLGGKIYTPPPDSILFDQKGCLYTPHVLGIQVGQEFVVKNSDPTLHNVHTLSKENRPFNIAQPRQGMTFTRKFEKPETFKVKCEVHPWMNAYVGVFTHPFYAVTGDDGSFAIKNLPAGEYTVEAWHEKYGAQTMKVKVGTAETATVDFTYEGPKPGA